MFYFNLLLHIAYTAKKNSKGKACPEGISSNLDVPACLVIKKRNGNILIETKWNSMWV